MVFVRRREISFNNTCLEAVECDCEVKVLADCEPNFNLQVIKVERVRHCKTNTACCICCALVFLIELDVNALDAEHIHDVVNDAGCDCDFNKSVRHLDVADNKSDESDDIVNGDVAKESALFIAGKSFCRRCSRLFVFGEETHDIFNFDFDFFNTNEQHGQVKIDVAVCQAYAEQLLLFLPILAVYVFDVLSGAAEAVICVCVSRRHRNAGLVIILRRFRDCEFDLRIEERIK